MGDSPESRAKWNEERRRRRAASKTKAKPSTFHASDRFKALVSATRRPISFEALCDKLDRSPSATRKLLQEAKYNGVEITIGNDHIQMEQAAPVRTVKKTHIMPVNGKRQTIGVLSDIHAGSKYCLRDHVEDCVEHMYSRGVRSIVVPGDLLDGCYKHGVFELSHTGLEDQTRDLFEVLPKIKGLSYHCITGNHDETFSAKTGVNVGRYIKGYFGDHGRDDIDFYGRCGAFIEIAGAVIHLWHPLKGMSYALSYALQKQIESYSSGEKPHILLAGHWHQFCEIEVRGVFGMACPTFQGGGSAFSKRLGGHPALGGMVLSWDVAGKDLIRDFSVERRRYFEVETPERIREGM